MEHGHQVIVQNFAGIGISDALYEAAGALVVGEAFNIVRDEMVVRVKKPQPVKCEILREGQLLFTYLHLAPDSESTKGHVDSRT